MTPHPYWNELPAFRLERQRQSRGASDNRGWKDFDHNAIIVILAPPTTAMASTRLQAFAHMNVLIVDDDPVSALLAGEYLKSLGFTTEVVGDGQAALTRMEARLPDLVICDRRMPGLSGVELLEIVRERGPEWQEVVFVFLTALVDRRDRYAIMPLRPDGYIGKPITYAKLDVELANILEKWQERTGRSAERPPVDQAQ